MSVDLLYAAGADLRDPYLSPLFDDLAGFPPTLVLTGTRHRFVAIPAVCTGGFEMPA
ncbi:alpha/beta hydrolase fold domain-containing protein [Sphingomonas sp. UV9]|uniref:alpha/beta hydrolase fold domain-containing protein n=1 Tax=Sphingomonas sp. UV9 TaxID=1851410 RepID=UPI0019D00B57|nr:alpha/beta hydrolase fold domain-containing protein [Sphingomonas sp. UV9]